MLNKLYHVKHKGALRKHVIRSTLAFCAVAFLLAFASFDRPTSRALEVPLVVLSAGAFLYCVASLLLLLVAGIASQSIASVDDHHDDALHRADVQAATRLASLEQLATKRAAAAGGLAIASGDTGALSVVQTEASPGALSQASAPPHESLRPPRRGKKSKKKRKPAPGRSD